MIPNGTDFAQFLILKTAKAQFKKPQTGPEPH